MKKIIISLPAFILYITVLAQQKDFTPWLVFLLHQPHES